MSPWPGPQVTVSIVSWNTRELLRACLRPFEGEVRRRRCEVVVADNASSDGSPDMSPRDPSRRGR